MNSKNNTRLFRNYPVTHDFLNDPDFAEFLARADANDHTPDSPTPPDVEAQYIAPAPPSHSESPKSIPQQPIHSKWSVALDRRTRIAVSPRIKPRPFPPIRGAPRPRKNHPIFQSHIDILIIFHPRRRFPNPLAG